MVANRHDVDGDLRAQIFAIGRQGEVAKGGANGAHAIRARRRSVGVKNKCRKKNFYSFRGYIHRFFQMIRTPCTSHKKKKNHSTHTFQFITERAPAATSFNTKRQRAHLQNLNHNSHVVVIH